VTAGGSPISQYRYRHKQAIAITYTLAFEEQQARIYAGLSLEQYAALPGSPRWIDPDAPTLSKAEVLLLYRMAHSIDAVAQDAATPLKKH
jgi:hypothetical protein